MDDQQRQSAKFWLTVIGIAVAVLMVVWYLTDRRLTAGQQAVLVGLTAAATAIPQLVEQQFRKAA